MSLSFSHSIIFLYICNSLIKHSIQGLYMKTVINDTAFIIKFAYPLPVDASGEPLKDTNGRRVVPRVRESKCFIRVGTAFDPEKKLGEVIVETTARTHSKDNFVRSYGRCHTFLKALNELFGNSELCAKYGLVESEHRRQFMKDFNEQCRKTFRQVSLNMYHF